MRIDIAVSDFEQSGNISSNDRLNKSDCILQGVDPNCQ